MVKSMLGLPKLVQHLTDYVEVFGIEAESQTWHKAESLQICGAANTIIRMRNLDRLLTACQMIEPLLYKLP